MVKHFLALLAILGIFVNSAASQACCQQTDEHDLEHAMIQASELGQGDKKTSELLARLISKDLEIVFMLKKLNLSGHELWNFYHEISKDNLELFSEKIRRSYQQLAPTSSIR